MNINENAKKVNFLLLVHKNQNSERHIIWLIDFKIIYKIVRGKWLIAAARITDQQFIFIICEEVKDCYSFYFTSDISFCSRWEPDTARTT